MSETVACHTASVADDKATKAALGCILIPIGVVVVGVLVIVGIFVFSPKDPANAYSAQSIQACRDAVRADLKAPSTADFSSEQADKTSDDPVTYRVTGSVDADNSYGAHIRSSYTCTAEPHEDGTTDTSGVSVNG